MPIGRGYYLVHVRALMRLVRKSSEQALTKYEEFKCESTIHVGLSNNPEIVKAVAESDIRFAFHNDIVTRLKTDPEFRKKIGGAKWAIEVLDLSTKMDQSQILP